MALWKRILLTLTFLPILLAGGASGGYYLTLHQVSAALRVTGLPITPPPDAKRRILVLAPHCDDETVALGGLIADARAAGAYPDLEARIPKSIGVRSATTVDSGRSCTDAALGALVSHGIHELRFAGGTWDEGGGNAESIAVLGLPGGQPLTAAWAEELYETGARTAKRTENIETSRPTYPGVGAVYRLDTLNELSYQTVIVWPDGPLVRVVIVANPVSPSASKVDHDARVDEAVAAAITVPSGSGLPSQRPSENPVLPSAT
jgi:hypothetical protein